DFCAHAEAHHDRPGGPPDGAEARLPQSHRPLQYVLEDLVYRWGLRGVSVRPLPDLAVYFARPLSQRAALRDAVHVQHRRSVPGWRPVRLQNGVSRGPRLPDWLERAVQADDHHWRVHRPVPDYHSRPRHCVRNADPRLFSVPDGHPDRRLDVAQLALLDPGYFHHRGCHHAHHRHHEHVHLRGPHDRSLPGQHRNCLVRASCPAPQARRQGGPRIAQHSGMPCVGRWQLIARRGIFLAILLNDMKTIAKLAFVCCLMSVPLWAQAPADNPVQVLRTPGWNKGVFVGGSTSFANTPSAQSFLVGARFGRVFTHELGTNALRGSFEMAVDVIPINEFWIGGNAQYAGAIDPFVAKWNFTGGKTV